MPSSGRNAQSSCVQRVIIVGDQTSQDVEFLCFTDDSGTTFFGVPELVDDQLVINFYTVDENGNLIPYNPTSAPVPCDPDDVELRDACWIALADGVDYSTGDQITEIQIIQLDPPPPTITGTIWYNQTTRTVIAAAPPQADLRTCDDAGPRLEIGYIRECVPFDINLPIRIEGNFSDNAGAVATLQSTPAAISIIREALNDALGYEQAEIANGMPVTNFFIVAQNGSTFEFPPSAYDPAQSNSTTLAFTTADLVAWPGPLAEVIATVVYSKFDGCVCFPVEMIQEFRGTELVLVGLFDPSVRDANGNKENLLPLPFGTTGPFSGPCPADEQVVQLEPLCCDSDLLANNPDIANQRLAWLDGSDPNLMLNAVGGVPINGNDGDQVFEVQDKIDPGVALSFRIPNTSAPGDTAPINPPTYLSDQFNGLSALSFNANNRERLRLDTGNPPGAPFTLFYLFSATVSGDANQAIMAVGPNASDGDSFFTQAGSWQFSRDSNFDSFIFRIEAVDAPANIIFQRNVGPSDGFSNGNDDRTIVPLAQAYDGQLHLLTATYDNNAGVVTVFFDGQIQLILDYTPAPSAIANFASDYFRIFGNRGGDAFGSGRVAELFYADSFFNAEEIGITNAYLICKWGIDPSLAAGGAGDLELAPAGTYNTPTPIVQIVRADGSVVYRNTDSGLEFPVPPVPGLSICGAGLGGENIGSEIPQCYVWDDNGTDEEVIAYAILGDAREFIRWNVLRGTPPPDLTDPAIFTLCDAGGGGGVAVDPVIAPKCYEWDNNGTTEQVTAYARLDDNGQFVAWVVLSGNPPPALNDPAALALCGCEGLTASGKVCYDPTPDNTFQGGGDTFTIPYVHQGVVHQLTFMSVVGNIVATVEENEGATGLPALHPPALLLNDDTFNLTFDPPLPAGAPATLRLSDVDGGEVITWVPLQDITGPTGNNVITDYTWNDAGVIGATATMTFTGGGLWFVGQFAAEQQAQLDIAEAWAFHDCEGNATYRDCLTGQILDDPAIVECLVGGARDQVVAPLCYEWDDNGVIEQVTAYARLNDNNAFVSWVVLNGAVPPDLTDPTVLTLCDGGGAGGATTETQIPQCYEWDDNGTTEQVIAYARLDDNGNFVSWVVLSGNLPPDLTDATIFTLCADEVTTEKTWSVDMCDVQADEPETVALYSGADGQGPPQQFQSASGNVVVDYVGGDFLSGQNGPEQGLVMLGTGAQDTTQALLTIEGATSDIVLSAFAFSPFENLRFSVAPIAWTNADQVSPFTFSGNSIPDITSTFTFPAGTETLVVRFSGDPATEALLVQLESVQEIITPFQRCFTKDAQNNVTFVDLDYDGNPYVIQGQEQAGCPNDCGVPAGGQICYAEPIFWRAEPQLNTYSVQATVGNVNTRMTMEAPDLISGFFFENDGLPGMNPTEHPAAIAPGSGGPVTITFDNPLPVDVPIILRLGDIQDPVESIVWSIPPDEQTPELDGEITEYTWDDASALNGGITVTFAGGFLWYIFAQFEAEINNPTLSAFPYADCDGNITYRNSAGNIVDASNEVPCEVQSRGSETLCDRINNANLVFDLDPGMDGLSSYIVEDSGVSVRVSGSGTSGPHSADRGYIFDEDGEVAIFEVVKTDSVFQLEVYDLDVGQLVRFDPVPIIVVGPVNDLGGGVYEGVASEGITSFSFLPANGPVVARADAVNADAYAFVGVNTSVAASEVPFRRNYDTNPPTDTDLNGGSYQVRGQVKPCECGCDEGGGTVAPTVLQKLTTDLATGQVWAADTDIPANMRTVEFGLTIITGVAGNLFADSFGNVYGDLPTGHTENIRAEEGGFIKPPISVAAGVGGRIIISVLGEV